MKFWTHSSKWVRWIFPSLVWDIKSSSKTVFLTFDDGPNDVVTPWVLEVLKAHNFKATFFCIGDNIQKNPSTYQKVLAAGHQVGNHTMNHVHGFFTPKKQYVKNLEACRDFCDSSLFRPPYGKITSGQIRLIQKDYSIVMWTTLSGDFDPKLNRQKALDFLKRATKPGAVVVFHDSLKAFENLKVLLPTYCDFLKQKGYTSTLISTS
ncbi:MAG: peptidoglycan/xylan/chitin deacetylase (PgdA/CDA1 family) [Bacteroidia bacterium]|jgi:peptidoglycan/xylan/chitin deacetylase (PgdA/CDA1 family)